MTGVTGLDELVAAAPALRPTYVAADLGGLGRRAPAARRRRHGGCARAAGRRRSRGRPAGGRTGTAAPTPGGAWSPPPPGRTWTRTGEPADVAGLRRIRRVAWAPTPQPSTEHGQTNADVSEHPDTRGQHGPSPAADRGRRRRPGTRGRRRAGVARPARRRCRSPSTSPSSRPRTTGCARALGRRRRADGCRRSRAPCRAVSGWTPSWSAAGWPGPASTPRELIAAGRVKVAGAVATKPATGVSTDVALVVAATDPDRPDYVSRGGHKLAGALAAFEPAGCGVAGRRCLDAGASTGGFTDVLLRARRRARWSRSTSATASWPGAAAGRAGRVHDRTNVRDARRRSDRWARSTSSSATSRSSRSTLVLRRAGRRAPAPDGDLVLMVKPQFEVGKERVGKGGVVRDPRAAGRRRSRRWPPRRPRRGLGCAGGDRQPAARARRATSSSSCGCAGPRRRAGRRSTPRCAGSATGAPVRRWRRDQPRRTRPGAACMAHTGRARRARGRRAGSADAAARARHRGAAARGRGAAEPRTLPGRRDRSSRRRRRGRGLRAGRSSIGGDGTILRAAELARASGTPLLGRQPRARRVPGRGGVRRRGRRRSTRSCDRRYTVEERLTIDVVVYRRTASWCTVDLGAERGQRGEGRPRADARGAWSRSTAGRCRAGAATAWCARRRPAPRRTTSPPAARWSGPGSRRC